MKKRRQPTKKSPKKVQNLSHPKAKRQHIPTAQHQPFMTEQQQQPIPKTYPRPHSHYSPALRDAFLRRNLDLDPQLIWPGKDTDGPAELTVNAPPLYIQEKIQPQAIINDLLRQTQQTQSQNQTQVDLFADFNGLPHEHARTEFYQHQANWSNRMILGDSLQVMASLAEREGLAGQVQCLYFDPPYGIKFNSNFQWSTTSRAVRDGDPHHITREPEQVQAFRDTWRHGIHSYLAYLRDRLTVARELLSDSGSCFVQIGDENVHRLRTVMDEVFGDKNFVSMITYRTTSGASQQNSVRRVSDYILWYVKDKENMKFRRLYEDKAIDTSTYNQLEFSDGNRRPMTTKERKDPAIIPEESKPFRKLPMHSRTGTDNKPCECFGKSWPIPKVRSWTYGMESFQRLIKAGRVNPDVTVLSSLYYHNDYPIIELTNSWEDTGPEIVKSYIVQTALTPIQRCVLMTTDPGDLVIDPTCGSGTTAYVAEQWVRRWITIDTSRVALALARARIMGARYPYYLLYDSPEGQRKEAELGHRQISKNKASVTGGNVRMGFVYRRVPHITLKSIANNKDIDVIWEKYEQKLLPLRELLAELTGAEAVLEEWEIPRELPSDWPKEVESIFTQFWKQRLNRQKEIDAAIDSKADYEYLWDQPYEDKNIVRVSGPFTVESLLPHRMLTANEDGDFIDPELEKQKQEDIRRRELRKRGEDPVFVDMILENLSAAGVQQAHKEDKIEFSSLERWPGRCIVAEGLYSVNEEKKGKEQSGPEVAPKRAAIFIGPEYGTVSRVDLTAAAREAIDGGFDVLVVCAFNYDAQCSDLSGIGPLPILKARMNADLHMADLKNTGKGNLFVIFGEPDVTVTTGRWLVDKRGKMVGNYDQVLKASGCDSLEQLNQIEKEELLARLGKASVWDQDEDLYLPSEGHIGSQLKLAMEVLKGLNERDVPLSLTEEEWTQVTIHGVDVYDPSKSQVRSDEPDQIACWFVDTEYNEESFFVRQAYFLGANEPYKALRTSLKAEINEEAWASLRKDTSRPFLKPPFGRIAVKVINHLGDEAMRVFRV